MINYKIIINYKIFIIYKKYFIFKWIQKKLMFISKVFLNFI